MTQTRFLYCFNDKAHFRRFLWGLVIMAVFAGLGVVVVPVAHAAATAFTCTGNTANGNLFTYDTIGNMAVNTGSGGSSITLTAGNTRTANDDPFASGGACADSAAGAKLGIFGRILCYFKSTVGQIISQMYCTFQSQLLGPLSLALTLFIMITGVAIMTGMVHFTVREGMMALLKIALVWTFATNASWGIGIGYAFFMGLAEQGSALVISAAGGSGAGTTLTSPDLVLGSVLDLTSQGVTGGNYMGLQSVPGTCLVWLVPIVILILVGLPALAVFVVNLIIQYIWLYVRAFLGYLTALVLIGFLFVLAPMFICFALFQITRPLFEQWLKYLTSFALQMVVVFAFLVILEMIPLGDFFNEIMLLFRGYDLTWKSTHMVSASSSCSICKYVINTTASLMDHALDATKPYPITCDATTTATIPISQLFTSQELVGAIVTQAVALWIVGKVMQDFVDRAPEFAKDLTGRLPFAAALGAATGALADGSAIEYPGLKAAEDFTSNLSGRVFGGGMSTGAVAARGALGVGLLYKTGIINNLMRRAPVGTNATSTPPGTTTTTMVAGGTNTAAGGTGSGVPGVPTTKSRGLTGGGMGGSPSSATKTGVATASGPSVMRPLMGANAMNLLRTAEVTRYNAEKLRYGEAAKGVQRDATTVRAALTSYEEGTGTLEQVKEAENSYNTSWQAYNASEQRLLKDRQQVENLLPSDKKIALEAMIFKSDDATTTAMTTNNTGVPYTVTHMRDYANQLIQHLQLQVSVRQTLYQAEGEDANLAALNNDITDAYADMMNSQTTESFEQVLRQLYVIQKKVT